MHEENSFLTLTFDDQHLPVDYSVSTRDMQLFIKKLRKQVQPKQVRFYLGAEYGDLNLRPHYHIILFGHDFQDKNTSNKIIKVSGSTLHHLSINYGRMATPL